MRLASVCRPVRSALVLALLTASPAVAQPFGAIAGRVTDAVSGRPVAGLTVVVSEAPGVFELFRTTSAPDGSYRLEAVDPGEYLVVALSSAGYVGELSDGTACHGRLVFFEPLAYFCGLDPVPAPPRLAVTPGATTQVSFAVARGGAVAGRVIAAATGEPVEGAVITVTDRVGSAMGEAVTGPDGRYRVSSLPGGRYRVVTDTQRRLADESWGGGHCDGSNPVFGDCDPQDGAPVPVALGQEVDGIDFELERLGTIAGSVTAAESGEPLSGVSVWAVRDDGVLRAAWSGPDGRFEVPALLAGEYRVSTLETPERADERWPNVACIVLTCGPAAGAPVPVAIDQTVEGIDFALDPAGSISGSVTADITGEPLADITLYLHDADGVHVLLAVSENDGNYRFGGLPAGEYRVSTLLFSQEDWTDEAYDGVVCGFSQPACFRLDGVDPVAVATGEETTGIDFSLQPSGAIAGRVTNEETGAPVPFSQILVRDPHDLGRPSLFVVGETGLDGSYITQGLPRGEYRVMTLRGGAGLELVDELYDGIPCFHQLCEPSPGTPVEVRSGTTTDGIDFSLRRGAVIEGRITREDSGAPAGETFVAAYDTWGRQIYSDEAHIDGSYRLVGLADGDYRLVTFSPPGLVDEVYDRIQCLHQTALGCDPLDGAAVRTEAAAPPPAIDFALASVLRPDTPCRPGRSRLCLADGRFEVGVRRGDFVLDDLGRARPISDSAGAFTFFADDNVEVVTRVIDACAGFDRFWAFAASLSSLGVEAGVRDTVTGEARFYTGLDTEPALDTDAFDSCAAAAAPAVAPPMPGSTAAATGSAGTCVPAPATLCLLGSRFAVEAEWNDGAGGSGKAGAVSLGDRSGYLWFHRPESPEVAVKAIDACALDLPSFWVFASGLTTSDVRLKVTDTVSGEIREIFNPLGQAFQPVRDAGTFDSCP